MFSPFDPLQAKSAQNTEVATNALKREINNILGSYVGWFDPFAELVQNALDAVEEHASSGGERDYKPQIWVTVDIAKSQLTVTDNGTGLTEQKFTQFLAPDVSFKSGRTRGHKGVGATYIAYGFNYIQIATKCGDYQAVGKMIDARKWLTDPNPAGNPQVKPDAEEVWGDAYKGIKHGTAVTVRFDQSTHPRDLGWIKAAKADVWHSILSVKTGIGAFIADKSIAVKVTVFDKDGKKTEFERQGIEYLWPNDIAGKSASYTDIKAKAQDLFDKHGQDYRMPGSYTNLEVFWDFLDAKKLSELIALDDAEKEIAEKFTPTVYFAYAYSATFWSSFNERLGIRSNTKLLAGGIQICANNMPQGELIQIPLTKNIGVQNQVHVLIHFDNCSSDLGRKGFQADIVDFAKEISKKLIQGPLLKFRKYLRPVTGAAADIRREDEVDRWKDQMSEYEKQQPLLIKRDVFFLPVKRISITSIPTREQDVVALFNQFLAGGIIRGLRIMSTNERFTYDSLYRVVLEEPKEHHLFDADTNPLGISQEVWEELKKGGLPFASRPKILEYKYKLDALMEDFETEEKNAKDIGLAVVWETGHRYHEHYQITSLLDKGNLGLRQYHGLTHIMTNLNTGAREMDLIVLKELVEALNDPAVTEANQRSKYEE